MERMSTVIITTFECISLSERFSAPPKYLFKAYMMPMTGNILKIVNRPGTASKPSLITLEIIGIGILNSSALEDGEGPGVQDTFRERRHPQGVRGVRMWRSSVMSGLISTMIFDIQSSAFSERRLKCSITDIA